MEYTVLGVAWKRGPCTTYALMKELSGSTSTYYKARAGTTYPLVERLIAAGLLSQRAENGPRGERLVDVTAEGVASLSGWLSPIEFSEVAHTVDFVRLRVFYLGVCTAPDREAFLDSAVARLQQQLIECDKAAARYAAMGDDFSRLATLGVVYETRARLEWLAEIRAEALAVPVGKPGRK